MEYEQSYSMAPINFSRYEITKSGLIYDLHRCKNMYPYVAKRGYYNIRLQDDNNVSRLMLMHRLLALMFIPNPDNKPFVNHIDGNKLNNDLSNLEWVTMLGNHVHGREHNLLKPSHITPDQALFICEQLDDGASVQELVDCYGFSYDAVRSIFRRESYKDISKDFCFYVEHRDSPLTDDQVIQICNMINDGISTREIGEYFNISLDRIRRIRNGRNYSHISRSILN